jgi:hypothetical protein
MAEQSGKNQSRDSHFQEVEAFDIHVQEIAGKRTELNELISKIKAVKNDEASFIEKFKKRFAPALLEIKPGEFAIIKPSGRSGAVRATYVGHKISFFDAQKKWVSLTEFEDYIIFYDRGGFDDVSGFEEQKEWLAECLEEIDKGQVKEDVT